ncbi:MAG: Tol-Pal system beta propeller repeat protein TolB [Gammaproteobacteria bacterium]
MKKLVVGLLLAFSSGAKAGLEITVTGGERAARPIAVVPFAQPADAGIDLAGIIAADLERSGQFKPLAPADMLERPTDAAQVNYKNWRALAVDSVVVGQLKRTAGKQSVRFQLLDVLRGQQLAGFEVDVPDPRRLRNVAHQLADLIYEKLTGVPGYFNSQIAYVAATGPIKNRLYQIVVADADGENPVPVATSREPLMSPSWSPDRSRLAYVGFERGRSTVYIHALASGELTRLAQERGINGAPAWSPDGRQLALTLSFERNPDIYVIDLANNTRRQLTQHFAIDTEPAWSPDGKTIVFTSDRGGQPQIYSVSSGGGDARRVTFEGKQNLRARFSPDGKSLALVNVDESGYRIGVLDLASRDLRILSDGPLDESPSFAPNGAVVIYAAQGRQGAELATVTVDGRIRQRLTQPGDVREPTWSSLIR